MPPVACLDGVTAPALALAGGRPPSASPSSLLPWIGDSVLSLFFSALDSHQRLHSLNSVFSVLQFSAQVRKDKQPWMQQVKTNTFVKSYKCCGIYHQQSFLFVNTPVLWSRAYFYKFKANDSCTLSTSEIYLNQFTFAIVSI
jgi:hypothetical protein